MWDAEDEERGRVRRRWWFSEPYAFSQAVCGRMGIDNCPFALASGGTALHEGIDEFRCFVLAVGDEIIEELDYV